MKNENNIRLNLDGWEMTRGSFFHKESKTTIYRTWNYCSSKSYWSCVTPNYKSKEFSNVYDAITEVQGRLNAKHSNIRS